MDRQSQLDRLCLIDVSEEDDSLISTATPEVEADRSLEFASSPLTQVGVERHVLSTLQQISSSEDGRVNEKPSALHEGAVSCQAEEQKNITSSGTDKDLPARCEEPFQPKRKRKAGQCNLRKSLAWDKAFFTNEGVLNPEELSLLNKTFKKPNGTSLPGIEEEESVRMSLDSNTSFSGDDLTLQYLEEKLFTEPQSSKHKFEDEDDNTQNAVFSETLTTQPQGPPQSNTKPLPTEKRYAATKVSETTLQSKASQAVPISFIAKRSSNKGIEDLQKANLSKDASGKIYSPAPMLATKNVRTSHKRMKYTHGNTLPANLTRTSSDRSSMGNIKDGFRINCNSSPSPNISASDYLGSAKYSASCSQIPFQNLEQSLSETPTEIVSGMTHLNGTRVCSSTSCARSLDGMSSAISSTVFTDLKVSNLKSNSDSLPSREQFTPTIDIGIPTGSAISQSTTQDNELEKTKAVHLPTKDDSTTACSTGMRFTALDAWSNSDSTLPGSYRSKPSGLRMPSPKLGFFDSEKVIRAPHPSALHKRSTGSRILPPKHIPRGSNSIHQGSKLKPPGVPCARLPSTSVNNYSFPSYDGNIPTNIFSSSLMRPDTMLKGVTPSIPAPLFQLQLKSNSEDSDLALLAQQKCDASLEAQQVSSCQKGDQKQLSMDPCQEEVAVITEDVENTLYLRSNFVQADQHIQKDNHGSEVGEGRYQLGLSEEKLTLQDRPKVLRPEAMLATRDSTKTPPATETGEVSNINEIIDLQPCHQHEMPLLADATIKDSLSQPVKPDQLLSPKQKEIEKIPEDFQISSTGRLGAGFDLIKNEEHDGACFQVSQTNVSNQNVSLHDKVKTVISNSASCSQMKNEVEFLVYSEPSLSSVNKVFEEFQTSAATRLETGLDLIQDKERDGAGSQVSQEIVNMKNDNSDDKFKSGISDLACSSQMKNGVEYVSQPIKSEQLLSPMERISGEFHISAVTKHETGSDSIPYEKQDGACSCDSQASINRQNEASDKKVKSGISNFACGLQIKKEVDCVSQSANSQLSLSSIERVSVPATSIDAGSDLTQIEDEIRTSMIGQNKNSNEMVKSGISKSSSALQLKDEIECNPEEIDFCGKALFNSNTEQVNTTETCSSSSQLSGCPLSVPVPEHNLDDKAHSFPVSVKSSHSSVLVGAQMESYGKDAVQEIKPDGRSPLAVNCMLLNAIDQEGSQAHIKVQNSSMLSKRRFTSSPLGDISGQENSMLEGQGAGGLYPKSYRRKSMGSLNVEVENIKNPSDASPFSEEWICALEAAGEEWLQMKRGPVQNSPPHKEVPQPGPWSPVRRHSQQLGPFDCTKYRNAPGSSDV